MEDEDDDFGDLYADVEVEATSAMNVECVSIEVGKQDVVNNDEDDDDDDLDIVLNSDDASVKQGEGFTIARNNANFRSKELEDDNLGAEDSHSLYTYLRSRTAAYGIESMGPQSSVAQRFSLHRARNILDVNIDIFEQKPWKHPGADITDYFNFGFNEDSWKLYCNQVDEYRRRGPVSPPSEPAQVDRKKGQAIQVEDSMFERQSSMDVTRQLDRDSDAIQITIEDPEDTSVPEASNHGEVSEDDHLCFSSASEDESLGGSYVETDIYPPPKMTRGSENHQALTDETLNDTIKSNEAEKSPFKSFEDDARRKAYYTHDRRLANKSDGKKGPDYERRLRDNRKHERCNTPVYKNRIHKDYEIDYRRRDDKRKSSEHRYHARHNPISDSTFRPRLHASEENISYSKSQVPYGYEDWDTERFGDEFVFRSSEEDEYYDEERRYVEDNRMMAGDWSHNEKKGENLYIRNKGEIDEFDLEPGYYDDTHEEMFTYSDRKRDYDEYTRWEFRGSGRNKRRSCSLHSELDNPLMKTYNEPSPSYINNSRWHGDMMPKSTSYKRHGGQCFDREDYIIDIGGCVDMKRKKYHWQSEIQWEDEIMFGKVSRRKRFVSEPTHPDRVEELIHGSGYIMERANGGRYYYKQKNEVLCGIKTYGKSRDRLPLSSRNSHLVVGEVKTYETHKKPEWLDFNTCRNDKVARADEKKAADKGLDIEEGEVLTEQVKVGPMIDKTRAHVNGNENSGFNTRILEAMAKMEKRRARFNEPITIARKDSDSSVKLLKVVDSVQETSSNKQQRPARKRRWGGS